MQLRRLTAVSCLVVAALVLAGCGGSDTGSGSNDSGKSGSALVDEAKKNLEANYAGTDRELPSSAPKPAADKNIWIITCSLAAEGCSAPGKALAEAAEVLGWTSTLVDGKLDPAVYNSSIRNAIADKADAVVLVSVDCALTKASLQAAKNEGIKVGGLYGLDCDDKYAGGGKKLFDFELQYADGQTYGEFMTGTYAQSIADYVIAKTDGKANVIAMRENDVAVVRHIGDGFVERMEQCSGCKVTSVEFTGADFLSGKLQAKVQTALTQNPNADVVFAPYDAAVTLGIAAGVKSAGRDDKVLLVGGEGLSPNIEMIKSGSGQDFAAGAPARWAGWALADELVRTFAGEPLVDEGIGVQSIDADNNIPTKTPFYDGNAETNYEANFRKIWGLTS